MSFGMVRSVVPRWHRAFDTAVRWRLSFVDVTGETTADAPLDPSSFWADSRVADPVVLTESVLKSGRDRVVDLSGPSAGPGGHPGATHLQARAVVRSGASTLVLLLHGYAAPGPFYEDHHARLLLRRGASAARLELPFHMSRRVPGSGPGSGYFSSDSSRTTAVLRQSVEDAAAVVAWARASGVARVAVLGFSLGGLVACLLAAHVELDAVIAVTPPCDLPDIVLARSPDRTRRRLGLTDGRGGPWGADTGQARAVLGEAMAPVIPSRLTPLTSPDRMTLVAADHDQIVGAGPVYELGRRWGAEVWGYPRGHITLMTTLGLTSRLHSRLLGHASVPAPVAAG